MRTTTDFQWALSQIIEWTKNKTELSVEYDEIQLSKITDNEELEVAFLAQSQYIDLHGFVHPTALILDGIQFNVSGNIYPSAEFWYKNVPEVAQLEKSKTPAVVPVTNLENSVISGDASGFSILSCQVMMHGKHKNAMKSLNTIFKFRNGLLADVG